MPTHKLKLKRTPEEEVLRRLRKERKKEKKRKHEEAGSTSSKSARAHENSHSHVKWASSDEDEIEIGPMPADASTSSSHIPPRSYAHKPDRGALEAEIEAQLFREKMFDAMGDDERLDSMEARLNEYAHIPDRWRTDGGSSRLNVFEGDDFLKLDPTTMDDEEYAEWIRAGMYRYVTICWFMWYSIDKASMRRKTHAEEYTEKQRQKAAKAARRAEEKARQAETARLEKAAEEERKQRKLERERRRFDSAREDYNARWVRLLATAADIATENTQAKNDMTTLSFDDIPWPIAAAHHRDRYERNHHHTKDLSATRKFITTEELTADAIASFLLPVAGEVSSQNVDQVAKKKERKDRLRETFLRFHPDKFEGRFMKRIKKEEREKVREAIGQVSRALNSLMGDG